MYYPLMLDLRGRRCVVIGGGLLAEGKVAQLLEAGAEVVVVSPEVTERIRRWAEEGRLTWVERPYRWGDLEGAWLGVAALGDPAANAAVWEEAEARQVWLNAVDDPPHCSAIAPAVHRDGDLVMAISTSGRAPALAVRLRDRFASQLGPEYGAFLELAGEVREEIARRVPSLAERAALWYRIVDSEILDLLRRGDQDLARQRLWELVEGAG